MEGDEYWMNRVPEPNNNEGGYDWSGSLFLENQETSLLLYDFMNTSETNNSPANSGAPRGLGSADLPDQDNPNLDLLGPNFLGIPRHRNANTFSPSASSHFIPQIPEGPFRTAPLVNDRTHAAGFPSGTQLEYVSENVGPFKSAVTTSSLEIASQANNRSRNLESIANGPIRQAPNGSFGVMLTPTSTSAKRKRECEDEKPSQLVLQRESHHSNNGSLHGVLAVQGRAGKVRGPLDEKSRRQTNMTRKIGACERCKKLKAKCLPAESPYEPCKQCRNSRPYIFKMPCLKSKITEASFFRIRPAAGVPLDATKREQLFEKLSDLPKASTMNRQLTLTQDFVTKLTVLVSAFKPVEGDKTGYTWKTNSGSSVTIEMPLYCLTSIENTKAAMSKYLEDTGSNILQAMLEVEKDITWDTIMMAMKFAKYNNESVVYRALKIWAASRMIERPWRVCGEDTLGVEPIDPTKYPSCPYVNAIPIPPIMAAQLDQIVIQSILIPLRDGVLNDLQHLIWDYKPERWFEIYLTIFVLLNSVETATAHSGKFARDFGFSQRYTNFPQIEGFFHGCKILLAHFHFVCKGAVPLKINWRDPKTSKLAKLDKEQVKFMKSTQDMIRRKRDDVISLRVKHKYDNALYWSHQLFFEDWKPGVTNIEDEMP